MQDILKPYIKHKPEDFIVEEILNREIVDNGEFSLFELNKINTSTMEAIRQISKEFKIPPTEIGFAGLKDKFAITKQYITIPIKYPLPKEFSLIQKGNKWLELFNCKIDKKYKGFCIKFLGYTDKKINIGDNQGNKFIIKISNLNKNLKRNIYKNIDLLKEIGFPNYFGEQRFGSIKGRNDLIFIDIINGKIENALKKYFSIKNKKLKYWGNWEKFYKEYKNQLEIYERDLILGLKRGLPFEKAIRILPKNIRLLFNFSFQSLLWNEYLKEYIKKKYPYKKIDFINNWKLYFYTSVYDLDYLKELEIPFTAKDFKPKDKLLNRIIKTTLKRFNITKDLFEKEIIGIKILTDEKRKAIVIPKDLAIIEKQSTYVRVSFTLPSGSYATILIRAILFL